MARKRKSSRCACGMSDIGDIGYTRKRKRRTTRRLHDIGDIGASRGRSSCKIVRIAGRGARKSCYIPGVGQRFVKM